MKFTKGSYIGDDIVIELSKAENLELRREMKNPSEKRRQMTERMLENENANIRIKALLTEFMNPEYEMENVRPYSPSQQEILRIYEDTVLNGAGDIPEDIEKVQGE
mgnify:CR=1 FL=1